MNRYHSLTLFAISSFLFGECSDLNYAECAEYPSYCEWNQEIEECQEIGGGGLGDIEYGP